MLILGKQEVLRPIVARAARSHWRQGLKIEFVKIESFAFFISPYLGIECLKPCLAVVKPEAAPGADVRQMPVPQIGPDDVLVKVKVASVCGTDLHIYNWDQWAQNRIKPPLIPGP